MLEIRHKEVTVWETVGEFAPAVYQYILWFLVFIGATILMTNTVEEKSTKLVEVLLSDLDSVQLMDGKLIGSALTLLTVVGLWIFLISLPILVAASIGVPFLPQVAEFIQSGALNSMFNPLFVVNFVIFFVLGFAFYGYSLSALGSVCSNIREAQMMATPINFSSNSSIDSHGSDRVRQIGYITNNNVVYTAVHTVCHDEYSS